MSCQWNLENCHFENTYKCDHCHYEGQCYKEAKIRERKTLNRRQAKVDKRQGSYFEYKNHKYNKTLLKGNDLSINMTLNSGATPLQKGDEQIRGLINIMEELKTKTTEQAPGKKSFTIKEEWLTKLKREANEENFEFFYLKFSFHENDKQVYIIVEQEQIMSMVKTMYEDRKENKRLSAKIDQLLKEKESLQKELAKIRIMLESK